MSDAAPPPWVKRAPGLSATHKFMLLSLWGFGPYLRTGPEEPDGERQPAAPVRPFPSRETLAEITGQALGTVKSQLRALVKAGWVRRDSGSTMTLAWREPGCFEYGERLDSRPPRPDIQPAEISAPPAGSSTPAAEISTPERLDSRPLTFQGTSNSTSSDVEAAARDPKPDHVTKVVNRAQRKPPELDEFATKLREVSQAAAMRWDPTDTHRASFSASLRQWALENSEADALTVLTAWEAARGTRGRPELGRLWYSGKCEGAFRDRALGRTKPRYDEDPRFPGVDVHAEILAMKAKRAANSAVAS